MAQPTKDSEKVHNNNPKLIIPTPISPLQIQRNTQPDNTQATLQSTYNKYLKHVKQNHILHNQITIIQQETIELHNKLDHIKKEHDEKRKRHRRTAEQISKNFKCPLKDCDRNYGSEGSLLQHIKLKHQVYYNSDEYQSIMLSKNKKNKEKLITYSLNHQAKGKDPQK